MSFYMCVGDVPQKRHTQFRGPDGSLSSEQVMGTKGFSGVESIHYHHYRPAAIRRVEDLCPACVEPEEEGALRHRHFKTAATPAGRRAAAFLPQRPGRRAWRFRSPRPCPRHDRIHQKTAVEPAERLFAAVQFGPDGAGLRPPAEARLAEKRCHKQKN